MFLLAGCGGASRPTVAELPPTEEAKPTPPPVEDVDPWAGRKDLVTAPPAEKPVPVGLPEVKRATLPNGMRLLVAPSQDLPVVSFRLAVPAGANDEPRDKRTLAAYTAAMLTKGSQKRTGAEIARTIGVLGGVLESSADIEATYVSCQALAAHASTCLSLLAELVVTPSFPEAEMPAVAAGLAANLRRGRETPPALASYHADNALWGEDHPRGWPPTEETLRAIGRKDLLAWHRARFVAGDAVLAIAGDVDPAAIEAEAIKVFGRWPRGKSPARKPYPDPKPKGVAVRIVDVPDVRDVYIVFAQMGLAHKDPGFISAAVMTQVLGGPAGRLAAAGGAASALEAWKQRGKVQVEAATRVADDGVAAAVKGIADELRRMREEGPTAAELVEAKLQLTGRYVMNFQNTADLATAILVADMHRLGDDWVARYPLAVDAVTPEQVKAAAAEIHTDNGVLVVVGDGHAIATQLAQLGLTAETVGWQEPISRRDRDKLKKILPAPEKAAAGRKLLDEALQAKGGAAKLRAIRDITAVGTVRITVGKQTVDGGWRRVFQTPNRMRVDFELPGGTMTLVSTEKGAWQRMGAQVDDLGKGMSDQSQAQIWREADTILLRHLEPGTLVEASGKMSPPGEKKSYDAVTIRRADGTNETRILIDPDTKMIFALLYAVGGTPALERFSDYRNVGGVQFAHRQQASGGNQILDITISSIKINGGVGPDVYQK